MQASRRSFLSLLAAQYSTGSQSSAAAADAPRPENAVTAIRSALQKYSLVGLGELHRNPQQHDFIHSLLNDRGFLSAATDIVVEFGNAKYQAVVDDYVSGSQVSSRELRNVWRETVNILVWDSPVYEQFFVEVRKVNQELSRARQMRVLLGDPPIDWTSIQHSKDWETIARERDAHAADVIEREVLARNRRALLIFGVGHLVRRSHLFTRHPDPRGNLAEILEKRQRHRVFLIWPHHSGWAMDGLEPRFSSWPVPSVSQLKGTWLGAASATPEGHSPRLADLADAFLWLGPAATLNQLPPSDELYRDPAYLSELLRRDAIQGGFNKKELDRLKNKALN